MAMIYDVAGNVVSVQKTRKCINPKLDKGKISNFKVRSGTAKAKHMCNFSRMRIPGRKGTIQTTP